MPLLKTVATWRCQCGIGIKVVGETDRTKPVSLQMAACPNCGFQQAIYVDEIISVTDDTANTVTGKRETL
jgi:hypothetical protein